MNTRWQGIRPAMVIALMGTLVVSSTGCVSNTSYKAVKKEASNAQRMYDEQHLRALELEAKNNELAQRMEGRRSQEHDEQIGAPRQRLGGGAG